MEFGTKYGPDRLNQDRAEQTEKYLASLPVSSCEVQHKLAEGAKVEIEGTPVIKGSIARVRVLIDDVELPNVREVITTLTEHTGTQLRIRCMERIEGVDLWTDYIVGNPTMYITARRN